MDINKITRVELDNLSTYTPGERQSYVEEKYGIPSNEVIKLASNENPLGASPRAIERIKDAADFVSIYPDSLCMSTRELIAEKMGVTSGNVLVSSGGEELFKLIGETFLTGDDEAIIAELGFGLHFKYTQMMGTDIKTIPLKEDFTYDLQGFLDAINEKTKIIFITNPANPIGNIIGKNDLEDFLDKVPDDVLVLLDEAYFEFANIHEDYPNGLDYLSKHSNLMVLRTFSKIAGLAGIRVGYLISSEEIVAALMKVKGVFNVNTLAIAAAEASLQDEDHINKTLMTNKMSLNLMMEYFDKKKIEYIYTYTNFIFVNFARDSRELHETLMSKGVIIRPGHLWKKDEWMRISSGTIEQTEKMLKVFDQVL